MPDSDIWEHLYRTDDPDTQAALDERRHEVLASTGRMPTWAEDVQFAVGYQRGRASMEHEPPC